MSYAEGAKLIATRPGQPGQEYPLGRRPLVIGRETDCDITVDSPVVSRHHARIEPGGNGYVISDAGATNGLFVNGKRVQGSQPLVPGDKIQVGEETFVFMPSMGEAHATQLVPPTTMMQRPAGAARPSAAPPPSPPRSAPRPDVAETASPSWPAAEPAASTPPPPPGYGQPAGYQPPPSYQAPPSYQQPPQYQPPPGYPPTGGYASAGYGQPVASNQPLAGFWRRLGGLVIDALIIGVVGGVLALIASAIGMSATSAESSLNFLIGIAYYTWGYGTGQTLGCRVLGLRIIDKNSGGAPGYGRGLGRYFAQILSAIPLGLGYFWMLWDSKKQTWHDKLAGTLVVYAGEPAPGDYHFNPPSTRL